MSEPLAPDELAALEYVLLDKGEPVIRSSDLATLAASPSPEGLDVERLARAQHASYERDPAVKRIEWPDLSEAEQRMWINHARVVAREYAALRTPEETPHA